LYAKSKP